MTTHIAHTDPDRAQVRELWQEMAPGWERRRDFLTAFSSQVTDWLVDRLDPQRGQTILELAAGPGDTGFVASRWISPGGHLISSDFAPDMVAVANRRAAELGIAGVEFRVLDAEQLDLPADCVDGVVCRWGYSLMLDPAAAFAETRRVLRPGGRLALSVMSTPQANPWGSRLMGSIVSLGLIEPPDPNHPGGLFSLADHDDLRHLLTSAGFTDLEIAHVPFTLRFTDFDDYWRFILEFAGGVSVLLANLEHHPRNAVREATRHAVAEFAAASGYEFPGVTVNAACQ